MTIRNINEARAQGGKAISGHPLLPLLGNRRLRFTASGRKSSEGDGRTSADIRHELADAKKED